MRKTLATFLAVAAVFAVFAASSSATPPGIIDAVRSTFTATGPGYPAHRRITCTTTAQDIAPTGGGTVLSYQCTAKGNVVVGGGSTLTSSSGVEYASGESFGGNFRVPEQCITASSTTVIQCRFLMTGQQ